MTGEGCLLHQYQAFRILEQMLKVCAQLDLLNMNASVGCEADLGGDDLAGKKFLCQELMLKSEMKPEQKCDIQE